MTGADTPSITVRQYGDAASIRSLILRQPDNTEFLLCWKGKYIVGITHVPAEAHFNVRYEYANSAVIAHDFFADDPYSGVLTIEASESSDPTPVADFETELRAFLQTIGVSNVALSRVAQLSWWNTNAAFYETPTEPITVPYGYETIPFDLSSVGIGSNVVGMMNDELIELEKVSATKFKVKLYNNCGDAALTNFVTQTLPNNQIEINGETNCASVDPAGELEFTCGALGEVASGFEFEGNGITGEVDWQNTQFYVEI